MLSGREAVMDLEPWNMCSGTLDMEAARMEGVVVEVLLLAAVEASTTPASPLPLSSRVKVIEDRPLKSGLG
jgi:hypothetical protein